MSVATFIRPLSARTRTTPERRLMLIGLEDGLKDIPTMFIAIEEDGLVSRFGLFEVSVDWRYDEEVGGWMDTNPTNEDAALEAEAGIT